LAWPQERESERAVAAAMSARVREDRFNGGSLVYAA
jgi:hypothetical protein